MTTVVPSDAESLPLAAKVLLGVALVLFIWRFAVPWRRWSDLFQMALILGVAAAVGAAPQGWRASLTTGVGAALLGTTAYWSERRSPANPARVPPLPDTPRARRLVRLLPWGFLTGLALEIALVVLYVTGALESRFGSVISAILLVVGVVLAGFTFVFWREAGRGDGSP